MKRWIAAGLMALLSGCGAETVGTAAVQAELKAQEAQQGQQMKQDVQEKLDAALQLQQQKMNEAAQAAGQ